MATKPKTVKLEFEEGWADDLLDDDITQEEMDYLMEGIKNLIDNGELFEFAVPFEELSEEEQAEIEYLFLTKHKYTRH